MIKYDDVLGMSVLSVKEGKDVGKLMRGVVDRKDGLVVGFLLVDTDGNERLLPIGDVGTYGKDVIMIHSESKLKSATELSQMADAVEFGGKIIGLRIITDKGREVGEVSSFHFDEKSGKVMNYEASGGLFQDLFEGKGLLPGEGIVSVGVDVLVVQESVADASKAQKVESKLKHTLDKVVSTTEWTVEETAKRLSKTARGASDFFTGKSAKPKKKAAKKKAQKKTQKRSTK